MMDFIYTIIKLIKSKAYLIHFETNGFVLLMVLSLVFGYIAGRYRYRSRAAINHGEARVRQLLTTYCQNRDAHVLNNITLRLENSSTTQIDHVLITTKGIFVIETKHYNWWIFANYKSPKWTQHTYMEKFTFQNPILQNYKHVKAIQKLFDFINPQYIHNIVVFSGAGIFKTIKPNNVFYIEELLPAIEQYSEDVLSLNRIQFCVGRLEYMRLELTQKTDVEHHAYLAQRFRQSE